MQVRGIGLEGGEHAAHAVNGVHAVLGPRTVAGTARRLDHPANHTLVRPHDVQESRLGHDGIIRHEVVLDEFLDAEKGVLFVRGVSENHAGGTGGLLLHESGERGEHHGRAGFHVAGTAAEQFPAFDLRTERLDDHAIDGHRVLMALEDHGERRRGRWLVNGDEIVAAGQHCLSAR